MRAIAVRRRASLFGTLTNWTTNGRSWFGVRRFGVRLGPRFVCRVKVNTRVRYPVPTASINAFNFSLLHGGAMCRRAISLFRINKMTSAHISPDYCLRLPRFRFAFSFVHTRHGRKTCEIFAQSTYHSHTVDAQTQRSPTQTQQRQRTMYDLCTEASPHSHSTVCSL